MSHNTVVVQEFGPEIAGERVSWISSRIHEHDDGPKMIQLDVTVGTVGEDGAQVTYLEYEGKGKVYHSGSISGFVTASAANVIYVHEADGSEREADHRLGSSGRRFGNDVSPNEIMRTSMGMQVSALDDSVEWVVGKDAIIPGVKGVLEQVGAMGAYPALYYLLGHATAHDSFKPTDKKGYVDPFDLLLPDPEMAEATQVEQDAARQIVEKLHKVQIADKEMLDNLTVFGDIPAEKISAAFEASRINVGELEKSAVQVSAGMYVPRTVHNFVGQGLGSRSWPYMDAMDGEKGYGLELNALRNRDPNVASGALKAELREIEARLQYATAGYNALSLLAAAESRLITTAIQ